MTTALLIALVSIVSTILLHFVFWRDDIEAEKFYKESYNEIEKGGYFLDKKILKPIVIVDSGKKVSKIRVFFKKTFHKLFSKGKVQVICVFGMEKEEERKKFMIQQALASEWEIIRVLDIDFIETAVNYFAFLYASNNKKVDDKTLYLLRKDFESSPYRECITKLDDTDFSESIVINPPPKKKPLLREIIMPMVLDQNNKFKGKPVQKIEEVKLMFMRLCEGMYGTICGVLFIGNMLSSEYLNLLSDNKDKFKCFLLCAIGHNIPKLEYIFIKLGKNQLLERQFDNVSIIGKLFYKNKKDVDYKRVFIECLG